MQNYLQNWLIDQLILKKRVTVEKIPTTVKEMDASSSESKNCSAPVRVVFFDDVCILCNSTVHYLIRIDRHRKLRYASLQSQLLKSLLTSQSAETDRSIIFWDGKNTYTQARAVAEILITVGGMHRLYGSLIKIFPSFLSNWGYSIVSRNRYRIFGKAEQCLIPDPDIKPLFLD